MSSPAAKNRVIPADLPRLATRDVSGHKGTFGKVLLVGGSYGMSGAISLSAMASLRSGAGLVHVAVPKSILPIVAGYNPCYMTIPCEEDAEGRLTARSADKFLPLAEQASCMVLGPGLGRSAEVTQLIKLLLEKVKGPMVVDADALFVIAQAPECLRGSAGVRVLTPHSGEFLRLLHPHETNAPGFKSRELEREAAHAFAKQHGVIVVLKGHQTFVTDGNRSATNTTGNPGMATGGSGDVLSGILGALIGQMPDAFDAVRLGVFVHGLAGDLAAAPLGEVSLIASDLISYLPEAFLAVK